MSYQKAERGVEGAAVGNKLNDALTPLEPQSRFGDKLLEV